MTRLSSLLLLLLPLLHGIQCDDEYPHFACEMTGDLCTITNIQVNRSHPHFQPTANDVNAVRRVSIHTSMIPVLMDDICKTFPRITYLKIATSNIEEIDDDAFDNCTSLEQLSLEQNRILMITSKTFDTNKNLSVLNLGNNRMKELPQDQFIFSDGLQELYLHNNLIKNFPAKFLRSTPTLEILYVHSNDLLDLNEHEILRNLPKLREIAYNRNELSCVRVLQINEVFRAAGVTIATTSVNRVRYYPQEPVEGITCSPDISWKAVHYRKLFNTSNDNKRLPKTTDRLDFVKPELDQVKALLNKLLKSL